VNELGRHLLTHSEFVDSLTLELSAVFPWSPSPTPLASENSRVLLLMQPPEEFLKTSVAQDGFHRIERVSKLVMAPGLVDEILAGMAREHDFGSAFATRHQVMSPCRDLSFTEDARLGHKIFVGSIANQCRIENGGRSGNRTHDRSNCSRVQGGVLVCAGLLPALAEGARFALAIVAVRKDLSGRAPRLSGFPPAAKLLNPWLVSSTNSHPAGAEWIVG
jgi:hypothetical protein